MRASRARSWWERTAGVWLAAWFLLAALDLPALHTCAMHGGGPTPGVAATVGHGTHAHGASHGGSHASAHDPAPARDAGHVCTCLGACCAAVGAPPPAQPAVADAAPLTPARARAPGRPAHEYVAAWVDFVLPFATAPPAALTA